MSEPTHEQTEPQTPEMAWPLEPMPLPAVFDVVPQEIDGMPIVVIATYTPAGATFGWMTRDNALTLARRIKKIAETGPAKSESADPKKAKQTAPKSKLIVPGGSATDK